jgi:hypothetical protein
MSKAAKASKASKAVKGKAKKGSPYELATGGDPFDRHLKSCDGDGSSTKFYFEYEARKAAREEGMAVRWFAHLLLVHYNPKKKPAPFSEKTPPNLPEELLGLLYKYQRRVTLAELLGRKERFMKVLSVRDLDSHRDGIPDLTDKVRHGFPRISETDAGYQHNMTPETNQYEDGKLSVTVTQRVEPGKYVTWTMGVDLKQVVLDCESVYMVQCDQMKIPDKAVTVTTNVREHMELLKLKPGRVAELEGFKMRARFGGGGSYIRFVPVDAEQEGPDGAVGLNVGVGGYWIEGKSLREHDGIKVGDQVQLKEPFLMYRHFALHALGTVAAIRMYKYAVYYLDLEDPGLVKQVELVHKGGKNSQVFQLPHHLASRKFQLEPCGVRLDEHQGLKVGDRVRFTRTFEMYKHFAVGQEGVVRGIRMFTNAVFYVELVDPALVAKVDATHAGVNPPYKLDYAQLPGQLAAAHSHLAIV